MNINELAKEVHENAVNHGWWEKPPSLPEALCLIHAELSEALEEYRNGSPLVYGTCALSAIAILPSPVRTWATLTPEGKRPEPASRRGSRSSWPT